MKKVGTIVGPSFKIIVIKKMTYFAFILVNSFPVTRRAFSFAKASCGLLEKKKLYRGVPCASTVRCSPPPNVETI